MNNIQNVYFIGIGGIGMSAIARYFNHRNVHVAGYDKTQTQLTRRLAAEGMDIHYEDNPKLVPADIDLVVYTPAIPKMHRELNYLRKQKVPIKKRAEVLGIISRNHKTIAVAGTHGKTTTTSILTHLLKTGGIDCTSFLGGIAKNYDGNFVAGQSEWVVVEADEYDRSFLHLHPEIGVILSMDADHLDIYGADEEVKKGFRAFGAQVNKKGLLLVNNNWVEVYKNNKKGFRTLKSYGLNVGNFRSTDLKVKNGYFVFDFYSENHHIEGLQFTLPGQHNVENATAAIAVALHLGISPADIRQALVSFKGIKRRFEIIYRSKKCVYIDDYAHHPSELAAAIKAARTLYPDKKLTGIFQPHLFSRTRDFMTGFAKVLSTLDEVILLDIYPAREKPIAGVSSDVLFAMIAAKSKYLTDKYNLMEVLSRYNPEVLLTLGAGDIDIFVEPIKNLLKNG